MSKKKEEILKKLKELAGKNFTNVPGEIVSVDEDAKTCIVKIDDIEYDDIRLNAVIADENEGHSYIVPAKDSWVMVSFVEDSDTDAYLSAFSEIEKAVLKANLIQINGGEQGGMPISAKLVEKYNAIESDINSLKQALANWTPSSGDGGAALKGLVTGWSGEQMQSTKVSDIENEKIKQ